MRKRYFYFLIIIFFISNCEYYKAYKYNEQGISEFTETKLAESKTSFYKSISFAYKSEIPIYNIGNALLQEEDFPAAHEKFQEAIELNPDFKEALYNDGQALYFWGKKEINPETCNVDRAKVIWEQAILRFVETSALPNSGDYKKPSIENAKFLEQEIAKLGKLKENNCKTDKSEKKDKSSEKDKSPEDKDDSGKDEKDSEDKDNSGKDGKDSKDKNNSGKDGKDSKDKDNSGKDGKDSKDKDNSGNDGEDDKTGSNDNLPADDGGPRKPTLTPDEQKRIKSEMDRINKRSGENKSHKRSRHQQDKKHKTTKELEKSLEEALW